MRNQHGRAGGRESGRADPFFALLLVLVCTGCGQQPWVAEGNYFTYDHPFTDAGTESTRQNAEGRCRQRSETAVMTSRACSLTLCTTSYQCMSEGDARRLAGEKK